MTAVRRAPNQQVVPRPRSSAGRSGRFCFMERDQVATDTRPTTDMAPVYDATAVEPLIYQRWLDADVFAPDGKGSTADGDKPPFVITQPPPNITGALHTGHALVATIEDMMIRRARMLGHPTLWLPGVDHASIDAQRRRLGASVDWNRLRFTMDEGSARAVRVAFKRLYDDGLAYRGEQLVNWCPGDQTSVSDLEVIATPTSGTLWSVRYHFVRDDGTSDPTDTITVATTRPETILGDTAVAVHPDDERYREVVGRNVLIPFVDRAVPVIADD